MQQQTYTIIADCGSTKADWCILKNGKISQQLQSIGFNPNQKSKELIVRILENLSKKTTSKIENAAIHFYGSGCSGPKQNKVVFDALSNVFQTQHITIYPDLLGAAKACCLHQPGIVVILGTGSNTVLYDGKKQVDNIPNLGFMVGDEGSGSHLGRLLLQAYFYREMPNDLTRKLSKKIEGGRSEVLDNLYGVDAVPGPYLAKFAKFYSENIEHSFIQKLLKASFSELIERYILKYENHQNLPIHFVGSIAFYFQDILQIVLHEYNLKMGRIIQKPIEGLVKFHIN